MTGAALATYAGSKSTVGVTGFGMIPWGHGCQVPTRDVTTLLERIQASTGRAQLRGHEQTTSGRFIEAWDEMMSQRGPRALNSVEDLYDLVESRTVTIDRGDTDFLCTLAATPGTPSSVANAAIRLMGMLEEDNLFPQASVVPVLTDLLHHDDTQRRYYAVKALWQAMATGAVDSMRRRLEHEESSEVRALLQRALVAMEP